MQPRTYPRSSRVSGDTWETGTGAEVPPLTRLTRLGGVTVLQTVASLRSTTAIHVMPRRGHFTNHDAHPSPSPNDSAAWKASTSMKSPK